MYEKLCQYYIQDFICLCADIIIFRHKLWPTSIMAFDLSITTSLTSEYGMSVHVFDDYMHAAITCRIHASQVGQ